jgi:hypothetical protein
LLGLLVALSGVRPSFLRDQLGPHPHLKEVMVNMKNLILMTRSEFNGITDKYWERPEVSGFSVQVSVFLFFFPDT